MDYILSFLFSIAERKDVGKSRTLRKTTTIVEERLSNTGLLLLFLKKREIHSRNSDDFAKHNMVKIVTFTFVVLGNQKERNKQEQIFTANTENSFGETTTSKSVGK